MGKRINGVELIAVGDWIDSSGNSVSYAPEDLADMAANSKRPEFAGLYVPLKLGHSGERDTAGGPALGWVENLRLSADKQVLLGDLTELPDVVYRAIEQKRYRQVSAEVFLDVRLVSEKGGQRIGPVLTGLALLGSELPAVAGLRGLDKYIEQGLEGVELRLFSRHQGAPQRTVPPEDSIMEKKEVQELIDAAVEGALRKFASAQKHDETGEAHKAELAAANKRILELEQGEKAKQVELGLTAFFTQRILLEKKLEGLVKAGKLTPALFTSTMVALEKQRDGFKATDQLSLPTEVTMSLLESASPKLPADGGAKHVRQEQVTGEDAGEKLASLARAYQREHAGTSFTAALEVVMSNNAELAQAYSMQSFEAEPNARLPSSGR